VSVALDSTERQWIDRKWALIRKSQQQADAANNTWNRINDAINEHPRRPAPRRADRGDFPLTDLMKAQAKSASLPLKDALDTGNWHSRNAERHIQDVMLFLKLKELGLK
jgi:hypothetical protein